MTELPPGRPRVLVVAGSMRVGSRTRVLCNLAEAAVTAGGGEARLLDLRELKLPVFEIDDRSQAELPAVKRVRETALWADGFVLGTPEYHGAISGSLKNWLDFLHKEIAGKLVGVLTVTGGDHGGDLSAAATIRSANSLHAFTLPYTVSAGRRDWEALELVNERVGSRVRRMACDVVRYAPVFKAEFERARALGGGVEAGFAGWYAERR